MCSLIDRPVLCQRLRARYGDGPARLGIPSSLPGSNPPPTYVITQAEPEQRAANRIGVIGIIDHGEPPSIKQGVNFFTRPGRAAKLSSWASTGSVPTEYGDRCENGQAIQRHVRSGRADQN